MSKSTDTTHNGSNISWSNAKLLSLPLCVVSLALCLTHDFLCQCDTL